MKTTTNAPLSRRLKILAGVCALVSLAAAPRLGQSVAPERGEVRGTVRFTGTPPAAEPVDMSADAACAAANAGRTVTVRNVVVGESGGLGDVIVHVKEAPRGSAPVGEPVLLDQRGCIYEPHVVTLRVGQPLLIRNSDATLHNVHVRAERNREFNIGQPITGLESRRTFAEAEVGIHVSCDVHGWMSGAIAVFDHPYFDVTGDDGGFVLPALPAGDYVVEAWHETLGVLTQRVSVTGAGAERLDFAFGS